MDRGNSLLEQVDRFLQYGSPQYNQKSALEFARSGVETGGGGGRVNLPCRWTAPAPP